jgi:copper chaperone CopZ
MHDFGCVSCAYAIERNGKKLPGVEDIRVDLAKREITVSYDGASDVLDAIVDIIRRIGHDASVRTGSGPTEATADAS